MRLIHCSVLFLPLFTYEKSVPCSKTGEPQMFSSFSKLMYGEAKGKMNKGDVEAIRKVNNRFIRNYTKFDLQ